MTNENVERDGLNVIGENERIKRAVIETIYKLQTPRAMSIINSLESIRIIKDVDKYREFIKSEIKTYSDTLVFGDGGLIV